MRSLAAAGALALLLVAAAGCGSDDASPRPAPTTSAQPVEEPVPTAGSTSDPASEPTGGASSASTICALLEDTEIAGVLGPVHGISSGTTFGGLADATGGQCVWTDDPGGDPFAAGATQVELVVFVPDGPNPPPADAPSPGVGQTVESGDGVWLATDDRLLWLRLTGSRAGDESLREGLAGLAAAVRSRL